jgi:hypothetical protein
MKSAHSVSLRFRRNSCDLASSAHDLAKVGVASSSLVSRSNLFMLVNRLRELLNVTYCS